MDLRKLARNAYLKTQDRTLTESNEFELKEEIILLGQEIEGLSEQIGDLSKENEALRSENLTLQDEIYRLKAELEFLDSTQDKR